MWAQLASTINSQGHLPSSRTAHTGLLKFHLRTGLVCLSHCLHRLLVSSLASPAAVVTLHELPRLASRSQCRGYTLGSQQTYRLCHLSRTLLSARQCHPAQRMLSYFVAGRYDDSCHRRRILLCIAARRCRLTVHVLALRSSECRNCIAIPDAVLLYSFCLSQYDCTVAYTRSIGITLALFTTVFCGPAVSTPPVELYRTIVRLIHVPPMSAILCGMHSSM